MRWLRNPPEGSSSLPRFDLPARTLPLSIHALARRGRTFAWVLCLVVLALAIWQANNSVCPKCGMSDVWLPDEDGHWLQARIYMPPVNEQQLNRAAAESHATIPAVVIVPGYLANIQFLEIPWVRDLARAGIAVMLLNRRGQGASGGYLWSRTQERLSLDDRNRDLRSAIGYLRQRSDIDGDRIAVVGHSDGGTAAMIAGSADWDIQATVAVSASVGPRSFVNHVAPLNLLLVYGAEDSFVLDETDKALMVRATRGYLTGPGVMGDLIDGSARKLVIVPRRGHLDVVDSEAARQEILRWLQGALRLDAERTERPSAPQRGWIWVGTAALLASVAFVPSRGSRYTIGAPVMPGVAGTVGPCVLVLFAWIAGLLLAPTIAASAQALSPGQETNVFVGMLTGPASVVSAVLAIAWARGGIARGGIGGVEGSNSTVVRAPASTDLIAALTASLWIILALHLLLQHQYGLTFTWPRALIFCGLLIVAMSAFLLLALALDRWTGPLSSATTLVLLSLVTALLCAFLFERMSMVPGFLTAAVMLAMAAFWFGRPRAAPAAVALLGAVLISWLGAVTCAFY